MPGARIRIRIHTPPSGGSGRKTGGTTGSGSSTGSGQKGGRSGSKADEHAHTSPSHVHRGIGVTNNPSGQPRETAACYTELKVFVDCINAVPSDVSICQGTFDAFMKCKDRADWWYKYGDYMK